VDRQHRVNTCFTGSRSNKKNDNCFVAQKNFSYLRNFVGYYRFSAEAQRDATAQIFGIMEAFGRERETELKKFLSLSNGIPDESTFFRVFQWVKPAALSACLYSWLAEAREIHAQSINIDGKTIRGSGKGEGNAVHVVSAWLEKKKSCLVSLL
jgi:hypothetical protein